MSEFLSADYIGFAMPWVAVVIAIALLFFVIRSTRKRSADDNDSNN